MSSEPAAHLNLYGTPDVPEALPAGKPLSRIHFPTGRTSMEAGIRLLADEYGVRTAVDPAEWRPILATSEAVFHQIMHRPLQP